MVDFSTLTLDEQEVVINAIENYKYKDVNTDVTMELVDSLFADKASEDYKRKREEEKAKKETEKKQLARKCDLIKAKMIYIFENTNEEKTTVREMDENPLTIGDIEGWFPKVEGDSEG